MDWFTFKTLAAEMTGTSKDALHVIFGVAGQLLATAALRRTIAHPLPWCCVLVAELINEWHDLTYEVWLDRPMWPGSVHDIIVTMALPTLLLVVARLAPNRIFSSPIAPPPGSPTDDDVRN